MTIGGANGLDIADAGARDGPRGGDDPIAAVSGRGDGRGRAGVARDLGGDGLEVSQSRKHLMTARLKAQSEFMRGAKRNRLNPFAKSNYATLEAVLEAVSEPLCENGLVLTQWAGEIEISGAKADRKTMRVYTRIEHAESSEYMVGWLTITLTKDDPQGIGSAMTYGRRYGLKSLLGIPEVDDDGAAASGQESELRKPRKSSAESKRDGTDKVFNEVRTAILDAINVEMLRHVGDTYKEVIADMPDRWADLLRDEYETKMSQLRTAA